MRDRFRSVFHRVRLFGARAPKQVPLYHRYPKHHIPTVRHVTPSYVPRPSPHAYPTDEYNSTHIIIKYKDPVQQYVDYKYPPEPKYKLRIRTRKDFSCCPSNDDVVGGTCNFFTEDCMKLMENGNMVSCNNTRRFA